jgi:ubiquitin carboxyl-terminal hydrolase 5/13
MLTHTEDWTPKKLEVEVPMPEHLDLGQLRSTGPAEGEQLQPEQPAAAAAGGGGAAAAAAAAPEPDATIVAQLVSMGFSENGSKRAGEQYAKPAGQEGPVCLT